VAIISVRADALAAAIRATTVKPPGEVTLPTWLDHWTTVLVGGADGTKLYGAVGQLRVRVPVEDARVAEPGVVLLASKMLRALRCLGKHTVRFTVRNINAERVEIEYASDHGASDSYEADRWREYPARSGSFEGFASDASASGCVLKSALDIASAFVSAEDKDAAMFLGCVTLSPGRVTATDGTRAVIVTSTGLPDVAACLQRDAAAGIARILRGLGRDNVVSVAVAPGRLRVSDVSSGVTVVACHQTVRVRSNLREPTGVPLLAIEAETLELARTLGFLRKATALWARPAVVERESRVGLEIRARGASLTAGMPVRRGAWTGVAERVPEVAFSCLEAVMVGLAAQRAMIEFRIVGQSCLVSSVERVTVDRKATAAAKASASEEMLITRCAISPAATTDPKEAAAYGEG
jgi:hypothetical protein